MANGVFIFGEVLFDCFPDGREVLGGAPFNVAWHLQAFDQSPMFISRVGDDAAGRRVRRAMSAWGMCTRFLQIDSHRPTGRVSVTFDGGEPRYEIVPGSAFDFIASGDVPAPPRGLIYHGSLALRNEVSAAALERLKHQSEARVFVDVNLRAPWWRRDRVLGLIDGAHWVKLNREEYWLLGGGRGAEAVAAERFREAHGLEGVVLTLGAEGAVGASVGTDPVRVEAKPVDRVVDAVGAGDAFASVLILGLQLGWTLAATLERAQEFASALLHRRGATVSDPSFYRPFQRQWGLAVRGPTPAPAKPDLLP